MYANFNSTHALFRVFAPLSVSGLLSYFPILFIVLKRSMPRVIRLMK